MKKAAFFVHGFLTGPSDFGRLFDEVEEKYDCIFKCVLPGHGDNPNFEEFTCEATYRYVLAEFDKLAKKYDTIDVFGVSMGGAISTHLAKMREFRNLILLAPANKFLNPKMPLELAKFQLGKIRETFKIGEKSFKENIKSLDEALAVYKDNDKTAAEFAKKTLLPNYNAHTLSTLLSVVKTANRGLIEINNPTLILWGKLDQLVPYASCEWLYSLCTNPNSHLDVIPDISHLLMLSENDGWLIRKIQAFLDGNDRKESFINSRGDDAEEFGANNDKGDFTDSNYYKNNYIKWF